MWQMDLFTSTSANKVFMYVINRKIHLLNEIQSFLILGICSATGRNQLP